MPERFILKELSRYKIGTHADIIYRNSLLYPDREAYVCGNRRSTYFEFNGRVNRLIHALQRLGVQKGDVLGFLTWNCMEYAELYGAALKAGFIASPFNPRLKPDELRYVIDYSEATVLFVGGEFLETAAALREHLPRVKHLIALDGAGGLTYDELLASGSAEEPDIQPEEDDPVTLIYTSGTTGVPRGALYTQRGLVDDARTLIINTSLQPRDKHVQITPLFHIAGYTFFRVFLYIGGCNVIMKQFDPAAALETIQRERATHMSFVPTQMIAMLGVPDVEKYDLRSLKILWYGASIMPAEVLKRALQVFGPVIAQGYGQSESGPAITHMPIEDHNVLDQPEPQQRKLLSVGRPDIGVHVRVVDADGADLPEGQPGEIIVRSKHTMVEYWRRPEATRATVVDGWLHTGDIGYYDAQGYIYISDRKKDMIKTGGENVFPREVEEILYRHPAVLEAAVFGIPDPYWVEKVHAAVVLRKGAACSAEELIAFCKERIAGYKAPKSVEFMEALPKNAAGKILKRNLRETYEKD
jgi:acyl-CoA synthetase (AMP-forming)/AMP-acid ligase II